MKLLTRGLKETYERLKALSKQSRSGISLKSCLML
jgi:hypothetical protein